MKRRPSGGRKGPVLDEGSRLPSSDPIVEFLSIEAPEEFPRLRGCP